MVRSERGLDESAVRRARHAVATATAQTLEHVPHHSFRATDVAGGGPSMHPGSDSIARPNIGGGSSPLDKETANGVRCRP
ncbi:MAG: hypothetical protein D4R44_04085 [Actinobacteria bacterium]|nr:MAG: hypothetical protein D4R44_04085 [Actinomycetota bacterium]